MLQHLSEQMSALVTALIGATLGLLIATAPDRFWEALTFTAVVAALYYLYVLSSALFSTFNRPFGGFAYFFIFCVLAALAFVIFGNIWDPLEFFNHSKNKLEYMYIIAVLVFIKIGDFAPRAYMYYRKERQQNTSGGE